MTSITPALNLDLRAARFLSVLVPATLAVGYIGGAVQPDVQAFSVLHFLGLVAAVLLFVDVRAQTAHAPDRLLDKRERWQRDSAFRATHQIMTGTLFVAFLYTLPARMLGWWMPSIDDAIDFISAFAIVATAFPGMILAWRETGDKDD